MADDEAKPTRTRRPVVRGQNRVRWHMWAEADTLTRWRAWCERHGTKATPATMELIRAKLVSEGESGSNGENG